MSPDLNTAGGAVTTDLFRAMSRRTALKAGGLGAVGTVLGGSLFSALQAETKQRRRHGIFREPDDVTPAAKIFAIAQDAEQLAVTLYSRGVENGLGLADDDLDYFKAAAIQEQIHQRFFARLTGVKVQKPNHFSFPAGPDTFTDLRTWIIAQQHLEGVFDTAFLAAVRELAHQGMPRAAQIMAQIATNEAEHRVLAREVASGAGFETLPDINPGGEGTVPTSPPDNWAYTPVFVEAVSDVVRLATRDGFMSPRPGNNFEYHPIDFDSPLYRDVFERLMFLEPFINLSDHLEPGFPT
jgi:hypothetical protein